jgi:hypothetical protein
MTSMLLESQVFTPLKHILKLNIMQYQAGVSMYSPSAARQIDIDPVALRKSQAVFKVTDGLTPTDKQISGDDFTMAIQVLGSSPQLGAAYNLGQLFSYLMKTRNADLTQFEKSKEQQMYEQAMGQWQQMAQLAAEKGVPFSSPQPLPQQYGYNPGAPAGQQGETSPAPGVQGSTGGATNG